MPRKVCLTRTAHLMLQSHSGRRLHTFHPVSILYFQDCETYRRRPYALLWKSTVSLLSRQYSPWQSVSSRQSRDKYLLPKSSDVRKGFNCKTSSKLKSRNPTWPSNISASFALSTIAKSLWQPRNSIWRVASGRLTLTGRKMDVDKIFKSFGPGLIPLIAQINSFTLCTVGCCVARSKTSFTSVSKDAAGIRKCSKKKGLSSSG